MIHHFTRATRHLLFWSLILAALVLSAIRIFLADIDDYQLQLEQKIRETTHMPIRIGKLSAGMRGFNPEVIVGEIAVEGLDRQSQPPIQLKEVRIGLDFLDLLLTQDLLSSSRVTLVGANISVIRNEDGSFVIKGLQASDEQPLWLLQGGKYEILQSQITWQDLKRHGEAVHFDGFDLVLKNHYFDGSHEVHLLSNLPKQYGELLRISARIKGNIFAADNIEGQLYIEGTDLQATALVTGDLPLGLNLQSGAGDIRVWSLWRNSMPYHVAGYIQTQQINISKNQGKSLHLDTFAGNFAWSEKEGRWRLAGYDVDIFTNRQRWPDGEFYLQQDAQGNLSATIKQLDLPALMHIAPLLIAADNDYSRWLQLNPRGRLRDFNIYAGNDFQHYALLGNFDDVGIEYLDGFPQLQHLSGQLSANDNYGQITFASDNALINAQDWFRNVLDIKRLYGRMHWWQDAESWQFFCEDFQLDSADFQTVTDLKLLIPKSTDSAQIAMRTRFGQFSDISKVPLYLPAKIMGKDAVAWLDDAFIGGQIKHGEMVLNGALDQFPFTAGGGHFETIFAIENGEVQFNQDWPHLRDVHAEVQFLGENLQVAIIEGRSEQVGINQAVVTIPDLADSNHVYVLGQVQAKFMNSLQYLLKTPIRSKVEALPSLLAGEGDIPIDLDLKIPYSATDPVDVDVNAHLNNAQLTLKPVNLRVEGAKGVLNFTEDRISSDNIAASTLGYPIQARLSSDNVATYLNVDGVTSIDKLEKQFAFLQNDAASGEFAYTTKLTLPYDKVQPASLNIQSSLQGVTVDTRDSLAKNAEQEIPLKLDFQFGDSRHLPLQVHYGDQLQAFFLIDENQNTLHSGHIVFGEGEASRFQPAGLKLEIRQPTFNLSQAVGAFGESNAKQGWPALQQVLLETGQLIWQGQDLGGLQCDLQHRDQAWQGSINNAMAQGWLSIPDHLAGNNIINMQMDFLNLSAMDKLNFDAADEVVTELPLIEIDSKQLLWRSVDLGHLKLQTERLPNGMHFKKIQLRGAKSKIDLSVDWLKQATGTTTQVSGELNMEGFGHFLSELHFTDDIKETAAEITFKGGWGGAPHQFSLPRLNGQLQINLKDGRISSIEPGFGRLLGLIAMEQWVKRLSLDFTDVYRQGLAFDRINGHFKIKDGLAFTDDLTIDAVAAKFSIAGFVNLADKTLDQRVAVVPKSSDAVPIAGTIVGGIATIITKVMTDDYKEGYFFGSQYKLTGPWGNVEVTPLHEEDGLVNKTWRGLTDFGWLESITR